MALTASLRWLGKAVEQTATSAGLVTVRLRLPDIRFLLHYHEKVKQPSATRQAAALLGYRVAAIDQTGSLVFRAGLIGPFKVQGTSPVAIPQIQRAGKFFHSASFWLARSGGFTLYMLYIGGWGWCWGWFLGWFWVLETGFVSSGFCG